MTTWPEARAAKRERLAREAARRGALACTVCATALAPVLVALGETTHPTCVSDLGRGERHLERWQQ